MDATFIPELTLRKESIIHTPLLIYLVDTLRYRTGGKRKKFLAASRVLLGLKLIICRIY